MKRSNRIIIGLITAAVTFSAWMLIAGKEDFGKYNRHHGRWHCADQQEKNVAEPGKQQ